MEATVTYRANREPLVIFPGTYVICAVTGAKIPLEEIRYWSVERQEPYKDAQASLKRELEIRNVGKNLQLSDIS